VEAWLKCQYMREHLGEDFSGTVSAVTSFGVFVTLDAMYVEGLVHITELGGDYFRFDEARQELRGERTGIRYAIGARVRVQVSRVDLDGRKIDFRWVQEPGADILDKGSKRKNPLPSAPEKKGSKRLSPKKQSSAKEAKPQSLTEAVKKAAAKPQKNHKPKRRP
jgi:ribonuclease R